MKNRDPIYNSTGQHVGYKGNMHSGIDGQKVTCHIERCKHTWHTTSKLIYITCPSCRNKVRREQQTTGGTQDGPL